MNCPHCGIDVGDPRMQCPSCDAYLDGDGDTADSHALDGYGTTPAGIKLLCLLEIPALVVLAIGGVQLLLAAGLVANLVLTFAGGFLLAFAGTSLLKVLGLWTMQSWGWKLAMGLYALGAVLGVLGLLTPTLVDGVMLAMNMLFWVYVWDMEHLYVDGETTVSPD